MIYSLLAYLLSLLLDRVTGIRRDARAQDREILPLRYQLRTLQRTQKGRHGSARLMMSCATTSDTAPRWMRWCRWGCSGSNSAPGLPTYRP